MKHYLQDRPRVESPSLAKGTIMLRGVTPRGSMQTSPLPPLASKKTESVAIAMGTHVNGTDSTANSEAQSRPSVTCERASDGRITRIHVIASSGERISIDCSYGS